MVQSSAWRAHPWLTVTKIGMVIIVNAAAFVPGVYRKLDHAAYPLIVAVALYLVIAMLIRARWGLERLPLWLQTLWVFLDHAIWIASAVQVQYDMPSTLLSLLLTAETTITGWPVRRGFYHWVASTLFVMTFPLITGNPIGLLIIPRYMLPVLPGCVFFLLFVRLIGEVSEQRETSLRLEREAQRARKEAELANVQLREYAEQVEQMAVLRERNRLAREVHDTVAHGFTSIHMQLEVLDLLITQNPTEAHALLAEVKEQVRASLDETRRSVHALRPLQLEERQGIEAIRRLVTDFGRTTGIETDIVVSGTAYELDVAHEVCLYRAAQEGLTNAFRHGHAKRARIRLTFEVDRILLGIEDDGTGGPEQVTGGLGIVGIRERAAVLGGEVIAGRAPTGGFVLQVSLPVQATKEVGA